METARSLSLGLWREGPADLGVKQTRQALWRAVNSTCNVLDEGVFQQLPRSSWLPLPHPEQGWGLGGLGGVVLSMGTLRAVCVGVLRTSQLLY